MITEKESRKIMELIERLKIWGCDTEGAVHRLCDDTEFYEECIMMVLDSDEFSKFDKAVLNLNYKDAFESAHTLKGMFLNLGLTPLFKSINPIVENLRIMKVDTLVVDQIEFNDIKNEFFSIVREN